jgi:signal transduction histidine kinase/CheY-like chemotaxis protein/HPt (histidine-containing phosphotransfer) domain-containing protein
MIPGVPSGPGDPMPYMGIFFPFEFYPFVLLVCTVISLSLCARLWYGTKKVLSRSFAFYMATIFIWTGCKFAEFVIASPVGKFEALQMQWLGIAFLPCSFFVVAKALDNKPLKGFGLASVFLPGTIALLFVWTNHLHYFFWTANVRFLLPLEYRRALGFWIYLAYSYAQIGLSLVIMIRVARRSRGLFRKWMRLILLFFIIPVATNVFTMLALNRFAYDPTPIAYALSGLLMAQILKNFDVFEAIPYAKNVLLESINSPLIVVDSEGLIVGANDEAKRISPTDERLEGKSIAEIVPALAETTETIKAGDKRIWTHEGEGIEYLISCYNLKQTRKEWKAKILLFRDISELAKAQREADEARAKAEAANAAKSAFIATVSHELRNPLNAIIGLVDLDLQANLSAQIRDDLEVVLSSGNVILGLVNDLLDMSKIEAGKMELENADFDLHEKVRSVIRAFRPVASKKGLFLDLEIDDRTPRYVRGDSLRYGQVLMNLVSNAVKFTENGAVSVTVGPIEGEGLSDEKDRRTLGVIATVRDTGIGISPEGISLLFREFSQADPSISRRFGGTGLGLSICKKLVELFGGKIEVSSALGEGSVFSYTARFGPGVAGETEGGSSSAELPSGERLRVLVVDDDLVNAAVARRYLRRFGHEAMSAQTGAEALELVVRERPDLVLLDLGLPDMDGFEVCRRMRGESTARSGGEIPIVAMTARSDPGLRANCAQAGMAGCLSKPVDPADLKRLLESTAAKVHELGPRAASSVQTLGAALAPAAPPPEPTPPEAPLVDMRALLERTEGDEAFARELLGILVDEGPEKLSALHGALREGNVGALRKLAHALKGSALTLCALPLVASAGKLESACVEAAQLGEDRSDSSSFQPIESMAHDLEDCYDRTIAEAASILSRDD